MTKTGKCIQCPDGSWACGSDPQCPPRPPSEKVAVMGHIQFEVELWKTEGDPPFMVRLKPVLIDPAR